mmetsp:Transcript_89971/g.226283  ORF Transcript_89971/g.226283 Transcript_89971/m.226283 type:complete len:345 (-) Transcript_89971:370-1404(-)
MFRANVPNYPGPSAETSLPSVDCERSSREERHLLLHRSGNLRHRGCGAPETPQNRRRHRHNWLRPVFCARGHRFRKSFRALYVWPGLKLELHCPRGARDDLRRFGEGPLAGLVLVVPAQRFETGERDAWEVVLRVGPPNVRKVGRLRPASAVQHAMAAVHLGVAVVNCGVGSKMTGILGCAPGLALDETQPLEVHHGGLVAIAFGILGLHCPRERHRAPGSLRREVPVAGVEVLLEGIRIQAEPAAILCGEAELGVLEEHPTDLHRVPLVFCRGVLHGGGPHRPRGILHLHLHGKGVEHACLEFVVIALALEVTRVRRGAIEAVVVAMLTDRDDLPLLAAGHRP